MGVLGLNAFIWMGIPAHGAHGLLQGLLAHGTLLTLTLPLPLPLPLMKPPHVPREGLAIVP